MKTPRRATPSCTQIMNHHKVIPYKIV